MAVLHVGTVQECVLVVPEVSDGFLLFGLAELDRVLFIVEPLHSIDFVQFFLRLRINMVFLLAKIC